MKSKKGITLVALIITIIVLLILAMVSISLVINGGILDKAKYAVDKYSAEEIGEQIKLAYAESQMARFTEGDSSFSESLKAKLESTYGEGNVDILNAGDTILLKINENGNSKFYEYNPSTSETKEIPKGINYGSKEISEIQPGDDITIVTEKFKVFSVSDGKIKAMPYYNLKLDSNPMRQATKKEAEANQEGTSTFSTREYWQKDENGNEIAGWQDNIDEIDISNSANNIQKYIMAYKKTLEELGVENLEVNVARHSEIYVSGMTNEMRNPGQIGTFWTRSCYSTNTPIYLFRVIDKGDNYYANDYYPGKQRCSSNYRNANTINKYNRNLAFC